MNVISHRDADFAQKIQRMLAPSSLFDPAIEAQTREIVESVRTCGDAALVELTERFNGATLRPDQFALTQAELMAASLQADESLRAAIAETTRNVEGFCETLASQRLVDAKQPRSDRRREV